MTTRSVAIGLVIAAAIGAFCFFFDRVIRQGTLFSHQMPTIVYGGLVFGVLCVNPLLKRLRAKWVFTKGELAAICAFALLAGSVASWGLWQFLPSSIMLPHHHVRTRPEWEYEKVLDLPPERMLPDVSRNEDAVLTGYVTGRSEGTKHISLGDVPWYAWWRPLLFWIPLGLTITIATIGLAVVVHRQWSRHELLPYPISAFAHSLLPDEGRAWGGVFRSRLFWIGASMVFLIHMNNYMHRWYPGALVPIPLRVDFTALTEFFPTITDGGGSHLFLPWLSFTIIGLAYFLPSDVSFSMGVMPFAFCYVYGLLAAYGISVHYGDHMSLRVEAFLFLGGYVAVVLMVLYGGRHFYLNVLRRAVAFWDGPQRSQRAQRPSDTAAQRRDQMLPRRLDNVVDPTRPDIAANDDAQRGALPSETSESSVASVWGMRVFLVATLLFVVQLVAVGLEWQLAIAYTCVALMVWIVVARVVAESGAVEIGTQIFPGAVLWAVFGTVALGPRMLVIMLILSTVLLAGPGWATMPFAVQALKLGAMSGVKVGRLGAWAMATVVIATCICVPATIYWQYDQGGMATSRGWPMSVSTFAFDNAVRVKQQLEGQGSTELAESLSGWSRLAYVRPNWTCIVSFLVALALALVFAVCRLRFARWPLHPIVFIFLGGWQAVRMAWPFLIGWFVKRTVTKYGGARVYNLVKPLMVGIIAGELFARLCAMIVGLLYTAVTGTGAPGGGFH